MVADHTSPSIRHEIQPGVWLDARRAVWLAEPRLLVLADLHWGYATSHRARGSLFPLWGDDAMAQQIRALVADYQPAEMLWLGDTVHAAEGAAACEAFLRASPTPTTLIAGNHDRRWAGAGPRSLTRGRFFFHHGDLPLPTPTGCVALIGHHHPAVICGRGAGALVKVPALVAGPRRLVLPAFSPWAAGTPWAEPLADDEGIWAVAPRRIFLVPAARSVRSKSDVT